MTFVLPALAPDHPTDEDLSAGTPVSRTPTLRVPRYPTGHGASVAAPASVDFNRNALKTSQAAQAGWNSLTARVVIRMKSTMTPTWVMPNPGDVCEGAMEWRKRILSKACATRTKKLK